MSIVSSSPPSSSDLDTPAHSEPAQILLVGSLFNPNDLETLQIQERERETAKSKAESKVKQIPWDLAENLRTEHGFNLETSSLSGVSGRQFSTGGGLSTQDIMPFSSSPVLYPQSSSPPIVRQKRKLFQPWKPDEPRKRMMLGGFVLDEGDEEDEEDILVAEEGNGSTPNPTADRGPHYLETKVSTSAGLEEVAARSRSPSFPPLQRTERQSQIRHSIPVQTSSGKFVNISLRPISTQLSYEQTIAQRSLTAPGRAKKAYYGIDIHKLVDEHKTHEQADAARRTIEPRDRLSDTIEHAKEVTSNAKSSRHQMWTEKYRARKFTDLMGDERTHRSVLRWLKSWDSVVFPGNTKSLAKKKHHFADPRVLDERPQQRKILLLTGPPGLGKTTLAHVCAKQAGYETLEINASDERSRDVVKGRIRDAVGTENVRGIDVMKGEKKTRKAGRPVCVVVDEVDGVVSGSSGGGGEGGFMKALVDLIQLDHRNSQSLGDSSFETKKCKKGDKFRILRPIILICNDLYAPALRPLRISSCAEIIHVRKPPLEKAVNRLAGIFEKEGISSDADAIRGLCESSWGVGSRKQGRQSGGAGEGDMRGVLVQAEWIAHKLRSTSNSGKLARLTKAWIEEHIFNSDTNSSRGLGRGGVREIIERVFIEGAGLPNLPTKPPTDDTKSYIESQTAPVGISELRKRAAVTSIREMVDTLGDHDRLMSDCFATYPSRIYQDDTYLTKPIEAYDWLHFHDLLSSRVFGGQEWELTPYLSQSVCAFHHLFAAVNNEKRGWDVDHSAAVEFEGDTSSHSFSGPRADFVAHEAEKANRALITEFQSNFSAPLVRLYRSTDAVATELVPNVARMLAPEVKPVVVGGSGGGGSVASVRKQSEKNCVRIASRVMGGLNIHFEKVRVEIEGGGAHSHGGFALRMDPPLDSLATFHSDKSATTNINTTATAIPPPAPVRYAIRQVLDQEHRLDALRIRSENRLNRATGPSRTADEVDNDNNDDKENAANHHKKSSSTLALGTGKRDFFGRVIVNEARRPGSAGKGDGMEGGGMGMERGRVGNAAHEKRVWVSFHEGFSNAVRKPVELREFLDSF